LSITPAQDVPPSPSPAPVTPVKAKRRSLFDDAGEESTQFAKPAVPFEIHPQSFKDETFRRLDGSDQVSSFSPSLGFSHLFFLIDLFFLVSAPAN